MVRSIIKSHENKDIRWIRNGAVIGGRILLISNRSPNVKSVAGTLAGLEGYGVDTVENFLIRNMRSDLNEYQFIAVCVDDLYIQFHSLIKIMMVKREMPLLVFLDKYSGRENELLSRDPLLSFIKMPIDPSEFDRHLEQIQKGASAFQRQMDLTTLTHCR
jgi:hypothetical protein